MLAPRRLAEGDVRRGRLTDVMVIRRRPGMATDEQDQKPLCLLALLAGAASLAFSLGGLLTGSGVWLVGPVLGVGAIASYVFLRRTRRQKRLVAIARIGLAFAILSVAIPGFFLSVFTFMGD